MDTDHAELKSLLERTIAVTEDNNRLLRLIRRDTYIGLAIKVTLYLILLGVPIFFLSQYIGPLLSSFSSSTAGTPTSDQLQLLKDVYGL